MRQKLGGCNTLKQANAVNSCRPIVHLSLLCINSGLSCVDKLKLNVKLNSVQFDVRMNSRKRGVGESYPPSAMTPVNHHFPNANRPLQTTKSSTPSEGLTHI